MATLSIHLPCMAINMQPVRAINMLYIRNKFLGSELTMLVKHYSSSILSENNLLHQLALEIEKENNNQMFSIDAKKVKEIQDRIVREEYVFSPFRMVIFDDYEDGGKFRGMRREFFDIGTSGPEKTKSILIEPEDQLVLSSLSNVLKRKLSKVMSKQSFAYRDDVNWNHLLKEIVAWGKTKCVIYYEYEFDTSSISDQEFVKVVDNLIRKDEGQESIIKILNDICRVTTLTDGLKNDIISIPDAVSIIDVPFIGSIIKNSYLDIVDRQFEECKLAHVRYMGFGFLNVPPEKVSRRGRDEIFSIFGCTDLEYDWFCLEPGSQFECFDSLIKLLRTGGIQVKHKKGI